MNNLYKKSQYVCTRNLNILKHLDNLEKDKRLSGRISLMSILSS